MVYLPTFTIKNHRNVGKYTPDPVGYDPWIGSSYKFTNRGISCDGILSFSFVAWGESYFLDWKSIGMMEGSCSKFK